MKRKRLGDLLLEQGISQEQLDMALQHQRSSGSPLGEVLLNLKIATDEQLRAALAQQQNVDTWDLKENPPAADAIAIIPADICLKEILVGVELNGNTLTVAMRNPGDLDVVDRLYAITKKRIDPVQAADSQLAECLKELFNNDPSYSGSFETFVSAALADVDAPGDSEDKITEEETRPVIGMVNQIIGDALDRGASDIHIEPRVNNADVRYRIDGRLQKVREIPGPLLRMVVARIKIMAELDIANHRQPQDGRIEIRNGRRSMDLRVNVLPTLYGSRVVMRVLDRAVALKSLDQLGFSEFNAQLFRNMILRPHGMIIVTGPTGSGKTTTLYAAINEIKDVETNIMTCEDPVEYDLAGINQSQVNEKAGLTFAAQLRAILRQDPDVVLVGEIRDKETAETAIKAAMTGHLVFSTLHANDAPSSVPRLLDMGVEPYLLSTSLVGIVAQRLLRTLCPDCKQQGAVADSDKGFVEAALGYIPDHVWTPVGCPRCTNTGYRGRVGVHELLPVTEEVQHMISARETTEHIRHAAEPYGYHPMSFDAMQRVLAGQTSIKEAMRLVAFDTFRKVGDVRTLPLAS